MDNARYRHVFWDMGGTMVDTYPALDAALADVVRRHGHHITDHDVALLTRRSTGEAIDALSTRYSVPAEDFEAAASLLKRRWRTAPPPVMEGLRDVMAAVAGLNLVVTHRERGSAQSLLDALQIDVADLICPEDGYPRKPDPAMYTEMLRRHGLDPADCLAIGDRPLDAAAAQSAGMAAAMLFTPGIPLENGADFQLDSVRDLMPLLA